MSEDGRVKKAFLCVADISWISDQEVEGQALIQMRDGKQFAVEGSAGECWQSIADFQYLIEEGGWKDPFIEFKLK